MRQRLTLAGAMVAILGGLVGVGQAADWPQWMGPQRDGIWRETGLVASFPAEGPKVLWRQPVGIGYTGPAVADG
ncbi:MAG TPA: pyrrolo-quinoline quinone, partial [Gemmatales bacterium]|nr:pyrrolo-quinoline quinone [Gemmatales bacterium]